MAVALALMAPALLTSCVKDLTKEGAIFSCADYAVYPDSFCSMFTTVAPRDGRMAVYCGRYYGSYPLDGENAGYPVVEGSDTLVNVMFNMAPNRAIGGYDALTPYEIYVSDALLNTECAAKMVDSRITSGGRLMQIDGERCHWPIMAADAGWAMAAETVNDMASFSDAARRRTAAAKDMLDRDMANVYDSTEGLFCGLAADMEAAVLPVWMGADDYAALMTLSGNADRLNAMRWINRHHDKAYADGFVDSLAENVASRLWIPNLRMLSNTLYQRPFPISVAAADNLVQAKAIVTGAVDDAMASRIIRWTPMRENGLSMGYPDDGDVTDRRHTLTQAMWAIAAARVANDDAWAMAFGNLMASAANEMFYTEDDQHARHMLQGVVLRTIFGLNPGADGLHINPFVIDALGDYHKLSGFRYRNATLDVTVRGKGNIISTFAIDGKISASNVVAGDVAGHHEVEISLSGRSDSEHGVNISAGKKMPGAPVVTAVAPRRFQIESEGTASYVVYLNGAVSEVIGSKSYQLYAKAPFSAVCFEADADNQVTGYASKCCLYIPASDSISVPCTNVAQTGGRLLAKKDLAAKYVESTRFKNSSIRFSYNSAEDARYYIRLRYLDGLGVVNPGRQYALRRLTVNGSNCGLMVLTQRGPEKWRHDEDWWTMVGRTLPIEVELRQGSNDISVDYFAPEEDADFNHDANIVIPLAIEIIKSQSEIR